MNENSLADLDSNSSIKLLRSSPALPDFRAGALPARIFLRGIRRIPAKSGGAPSNFRSPHRLTVLE
jgi:hypothetical protein